MYDINDAELNQLILDARASLDQSYRKTLYKSCLDIIVDWAVEVPVYQRQNAIIFSTQRVNMNTVTPDITTFYGWLNEVQKVGAELTKFRTQDLGPDNMRLSRPGPGGHCGHRFAPAAYRGSDFQKIACAVGVQWRGGTDVFRQSASLYHQIGGLSVRKYIIKRILISIVILFLVSFVIYALMRCLPTSYVEAMARQKSMQPGSKSFEEWMEQLTHMYNLDVGIIPGFFKWLGQMLTFKFGDSWLWTKPVTEVFNNCVWISFFMGLIAFVLQIIIAIPLGVIAATKQYSKTDYVISVLALAGISLPTFFFASLLKLVFSVRLGWFDLYGLTGRNHEQLSAFAKLLDMGHHLVLPIVTLVVISVGSLMRYTRTNMLEVLNADFIRTARAKGLSERKVIYHHAFRNTLIPLVTIIGGSCPACSPVL